MSYYPGSDINIRDKGKVILDLPYYATKKRIRSCYKKMFYCFES